MPSPLLPPSFEDIGERTFSFYPPIIGVEHNEWQLRQVTWSEFLVSNTLTGAEVWISRRFVGEVSRVEDPVMIVGLQRELEWKAGQVVPHTRQVIEIPRAVNQSHTHPPPADLRPAPIVGIGRSPGTESRVGRLLAGAVLGAIVLCVLAVAFFRADRTTRVSYSPVLQSELGLTHGDDYYAVVRKLGSPASDRWSAKGSGEMQYRVLQYPGPGVSVILMGSEKERVLYIGAVDAQWRPVHAVTLPGGSDTYSLLRSLKPDTTPR